MSLFHKLNHVSEKDVPARILKALEGEKPNPNWNNCLPVNLREITMEQFAQSKYFTYTPDYTRFNQCPEKENEVILNWHEYWYNDGTGFALVADYWEKKIRVFKLGCEHSYSEVGSAKELAELYPELAGQFEGGRCMHNTVCTKCRSLWIYDSSD